MTALFLASKDEKKAMEYMKERYEDTSAKGHTKIIRQPKKLDNTWEKYVVILIVW